MDFKLEHDVDKGPIIRWFANQAMNISGWLAKTSAPYADMYTAVWDDYEEDGVENEGSRRFQRRLIL
jgi:hypothetical protein